MRLELEEQATQYKLTGTVAWDCGDATGEDAIDISSCQTCTVTRYDTNIDPDFAGPGRWGMSFQDKHYLLERFRAGPATGN